jgi:hypothetical protein
VVRQCAYCGKPVGTHVTQCPSCREAIPELRLTARTGRDGNREIRRGLLYLVLAAVFHYFIGAYSAMNLPIARIVITYLSPLLFLGGLGLIGYGVFLKIRS